jgi:hypothetical protein
MSCYGKKISNFKFQISNFWTLIFLVMVINGCAPQIVKPEKICPGKVTAQEALDVLKAEVQKVRPFKAKGQCLARFYEQVKGHKKEHKEEFTVRLWLSPPSRLRFWADVAFNARGLDIGSNESEFWIAAKPKELGNSFFWGKWSEQSKSGNLRLSPDILLEGFGIVNPNGQTAWSLAKNGHFDVLIEKEGDAVLKKIYIERCYCRIERIEYFGSTELAEVSKQTKSAIVVLKGYKKFFDGVVLPAEINIKSFRNDGTEDTFRIVLNNVQPFEVTEDNWKVFFGRPDELKGFEHIYRVVDDKLIEQ